MAVASSILNYLLLSLLSTKPYGNIRKSKAAPNLRSESKAIAVVWPLPHNDVK